MMVVIIIIFVYCYLRRIKRHINVKIYRCRQSYQQYCWIVCVCLNVRLYIYIYISICVLVYTREGHIYDPWSQWNGNDERERVPSCFSPSVFLPFFLTRHYDRIHLSALCSSQEQSQMVVASYVCSGDIFRRNGFESSAFFLSFSNLPTT